jgi:hypothetical protein
VIFDASIANAKRFVAVPRFSSYPTTGFGNYEILEFIPVYLDTIYANCSATACNTVFSPGAGAAAPACSSPLAVTDVACGFSGGWTPPPGPAGAVEGLTAFTIKIGMLPASVVENFPGSPGIRVYSLTE